MTLNARTLLSRRALLGSLGVASLSPLFRGARAYAGGESAPKRFVVVHVPEGMWRGAPRPAVGAGGSLGPILGALEPFRSHVLVLNNLNIASRDSGPGGDGHHRGVVHMLTGIEALDGGSSAGGPSVDQVIAGAIGAGARFQSLQFGVRIIYGDTNSRCIWGGPRLVRPAMQDPWAAYTRIFRDVMPGAPRPAVDLRRSALDYATAELGALAPRLAPSDRQRLESYHESLRDIERRLAVLPPMGTGCVPPTLGAMADPRAEASYPRVGRLQMDLLVAALQCDLTRVASLQWGNSNDQCSYPFLGYSGKVGHDFAHNNENCDPTGAKKLRVYQWYAEQFAYLLGRLQSVREGAGTMLDNTLVLWVSEFGDSNGHSGSNLMWALMGNLGGYFRSGRVIDCGGRSVNDLHTALQNAYGVTATTFGNPRFCAGALPNLR